MKFVLVVRVQLCRPFAHWKQHFDAHRDARRAGGIEDVFCYPVIGEQAVIYGVRTSTPRSVHDMIYDEAIRPLIEASGFVVGSEQITVCEDLE
jgi:hypothetical protein